MIVEMRTYELEPGRLAQFLKHMESEGLPIERPVLGRMLGFYTSEIGELNQVIHMWGYESFEDRQHRRQALNNNPQWAEFLPKVLPLIRHMRNQLLLPTTFAAPHTLDWAKPFQSKSGS